MEYSGISMIMENAGNAWRWFLCSITQKFMFKIKKYANCYACLSLSFCLWAEMLQFESGLTVIFFSISSIILSHFKPFLY